jgi:hypothetical protein
MKLHQEIEQVDLRGDPELFAQPVAADLYPPDGNIFQLRNLLTGKIHPQISAEL